MNLPKDPVILLSFVNTQLRDNYASLDELCHAFDADATVICETLAKIDYYYDKDSNSFR